MGPYTQCRKYPIACINMAGLNIAVFKKHHTTDDQFQKSLKYYTTQPDRLQEMYNKIDAILKRLTLQPDRISQPNAPKNIKSKTACKR
jgi:hypothetical protein